MRWIPSWVPSTPGVVCRLLNCVRTNWWNRGKPITAAVLNGIYLDLLKQYYGDAVALDDAYKYTWTRIRTSNLLALTCTNTPLVLRPRPSCLAT